MTHHAQSTYLQTLQQIEDERVAALRGLIGPAIVARHAFIEARITHRANRILELIEQHRMSEAELLMEHPTWGEDNGASTVPLPDEDDAFLLDEATCTLHIAQQHFVVLSHILVRHPLLQQRHVRESLPTQQGPDADGYELDALLFRFVPASDALAAHLDEAVLTLPLGWRRSAHLRLATWRETPIAFSLAPCWDPHLDFQHRFASIHDYFKRFPLREPCIPTREAEAIVWSQPIPLVVLDRAAGEDRSALQERHHYDCEG